MRKVFEFIYMCPVTGARVKSTIENFFSMGQDLNSQVEVLFETRIAPLSTIISYKEV